MGKPTFPLLPLDCMVFASSYLHLDTPPPAVFLGIWARPILTVPVTDADGHGGGDGAIVIGVSSRCSLEPGAFFHRADSLPVSSSGDLSDLSILPFVPSSSPPNPLPPSNRGENTEQPRMPACCVSVSLWPWLEHRFSQSSPLAAVDV